MNNLKKEKTMLKLLALCLGMLFIYELAVNIGVLSVSENPQILSLFIYGSGLISFANIGKKLFK